MNDGRIGAIFLAAGLVITGLLLLFVNFGLLASFEPQVQYVAAGGFAVAGVGFLVSYVSRRAMWWRLIPGWTLLSVACMLLFSTVPAINPLLIPAVLFVGLALAFGNIYWVNRRTNWWAVIPAGFMLVLSVVIGLNTIMESQESLFAVLIIGIGAVFLLLAAIGPPQVRWWPLIPALVLLLFGLIMVTGDDGSESPLFLWWPALLIALGIVLGWRALTRTRQPERLSVNVAPGTNTTGKPVVTSSAKPVAENAAQQPGVEAGVLGEYTEPAPGASVEIISDYDERD